MSSPAAWKRISILTLWTAKNRPRRTARIERRSASLIVDSGMRTFCSVAFAFDTSARGPSTMPTRPSPQNKEMLSRAMLLARLPLEIPPVAHLLPASRDPAGSATATSHSRADQSNAVKVGESASPGSHGGIRAIDTRIPVVQQYRLERRAATPKASSRAWTPGAARQSALLASPASSRKLPRGCRSYANGDMDPGWANRRRALTLTRTNTFGHVARHLITPPTQLVTFFPVEFRDEYFSGEKCFGHGTSRSMVAGSQRRRASGQTWRP